MLFFPTAAAKEKKKKIKYFFEISQRVREVGRDGYFDIISPCRAGTWRRPSKKCPSHQTKPRKKTRISLNKRKKIGCFDIVFL
jgi:hypothetical protein